MKIVNCEQRDYQWFLARMGKPTASGFCELVTAAGKARTGTAPRKYLLELLGERLTQEPAATFETEAMRRGVELEPKARAWYSLATGRNVQQVGIVLSDCGRWGGSPDGLCEDRGVEIKCPMPPVYLDICESGKIPDDHIIQVQACMWITGLPRWDYCLYTDKRGLQAQVIECVPDAKLHAAFAEIIPAACDWLDEAEARMRKAGHGYTPPADDRPTWEEIINGTTVA